MQVRHPSARGRGGAGGGWEFLAHGRTERRLYVRARLHVRAGRGTLRTAHRALAQATKTNKKQRQTIKNTLGGSFGEVWRIFWRGFLQVWGGLRGEVWGIFGEVFGGKTEKKKQDIISTL